MNDESDYSVGFTHCNELIVVFNSRSGPEWQRNYTISMLQSSLAKIRQDVPLCIIKSILI